MKESNKLQLFISHLKATGRIKNQEEFGNMLGYNNKSSLSRVLSNPTEPFLNKLNSVFPEYKNFEAPNFDLKPKNYPAYIEVKVVEIKARAGYADSYYSEEYLKDMPTVLIESDREYKGRYLAFEVENDSMEPEYYECDTVICREIKRDLWQYKLHFKDYDFVIAHGTKGIFFKEITDHNVETGEITCHSLNPDYMDFTLNLKEVTALYNVVEVRQSGKRKRHRR